VTCITLGIQLAVTIPDAVRTETNITTVAPINCSLPVSMLQGDSTVTAGRVILTKHCSGSNGFVLSGEHSLQYNISQKKKSLDDPNFGTTVITEFGAMLSSSFQNSNMYNFIMHFSFNKYCCRNW
jgi:hypothetical protein